MVNYQLITDRYLQVVIVDMVAKGFSGQYFHGSTAHTATVGCTKV